MHIRSLGSTGLQVSALGLGCMGMSYAYGTAASRDPNEARATLRRARDLGVDFFDTAEVYGPYANEALLGDTLRSIGGHWTVATKFGFRLDLDGKIAGLDGSPANVRRACEGSLKRLGRETIDLFYLHRVDPEVPIEETVGAMAELVREGKVRYLGLSEASTASIRRAHAVHPISALQSEYSLFERGIEREVLPTCRELGIGVVPYSPLGRGWLTRSVKSATDYQSEGDFRGTLPRFQGDNFNKNMELSKSLERLATRVGGTPAQLALAWLLSQGEDIVPIPGARQVRHLEDNVAAVELRLRACDLMALEEIFPRNAAAGERYPESFARFLDR